MTDREEYLPIHAVIQSERLETQTYQSEGSGCLEMEGTESISRKQGDLGLSQLQVLRTKWEGDPKPKTPGLVKGLLELRRYETSTQPPERRANRGVRASILAMRPGNSGGAKGRRKID
jgi:hypothetical protein